MENLSLKDLFVPTSEPEEICSEEVVILLHFQYGDKLYVTTIALIKEIVDLPVFIPLPVEAKFLGVFNLRGTIVPIFDPYNNGIQENGRPRLIVFEAEKGELVAVPANGIFKNVIEKEALLKQPAYVTVNNIPYENFDIIQKLKDSV